MTWERWQPTILKQYIGKYNHFLLLLPMDSSPVKYSIVVPVYNRPEEVDELLKSLLTQRYKNFEVIVVEDGSTIPCKAIVDRYAPGLDIHYLTKINSGPGPSRNAGFSIARGKYFIVFDSDCIIPEDYLMIIDTSIEKEKWDAWGGPDKAHGDFTLLQKAMGYTMASVLTTGGIRGGKKNITSFQPRSFNMGLSRKVFETTGGFQFDRFAEDIELSIRMKQAGFKVGLIPAAFVYHKRRTNFKQFFKQVFNFGRGRVHIGKRFPAEVKLTHWFPSLFTIGFMGWLLTPSFSMFLFQIVAAFLAIYFAAIFVLATITYKNILVGVLSIPSALVQLTGYGLGFISEKLK